MENKINALALDLFTYENVANIVGRSSRMIFNYAKKYDIKAGRKIPSEKTKYFTRDDVHRFAAKIAEIDGFEYKTSDVNSRIDEVKKMKDDFAGNYNEVKESDFGNDNETKNEDILDVSVDADYKETDKGKKHLATLNTVELIDRLMEDNYKYGKSEAELKVQAVRIKETKKELKVSRLMMAMLIVLFLGIGIFWYLAISKRGNELMSEKNERMKQEMLIGQKENEVLLYKQKLEFISKGQKNNDFQIQQYREIIQEKNERINEMNAKLEQLVKETNEINEEKMNKNVIEEMNEAE